MRARRALRVVPANGNTDVLTEAIRRSVREIRAQIDLLVDAHHSPDPKADIPEIVMAILHATHAIEMDANEIADGAKG